MFSRLELAPAYRQVSDTVEHMITSGQLRAGDLLPTETDLATQLGVNRSTVREGLRVLEHAGLVRREGKRLKVVIPHYLELASRASRALLMHQVTFRELWEASVAIEALSASLAAQRIDADGVRALADNIVEMQAKIEDIEAVVRLDIEFHDLLAEATGNRALSLAREPISLMFYPAGQIILPRLHTQQRIVDAHRQILQCVGQADSAGAREWMQRHMADFKRGYERTGVSMEQPLDSMT